MPLYAAILIASYNDRSLYEAHKDILEQSAVMRILSCECSRHTNQLMPPSLKCTKSTFNPVVGAGRPGSVNKKTKWYPEGIPNPTDLALKAARGETVIVHFDDAADNGKAIDDPNEIKIMHDGRNILNLGRHLLGSRRWVKRDGKISSEYSLF